MNKGISELMDDFSAMKKSEDFVGFTFNGISSSDLGIVRTSNGDRFDMSLSPDFDNTTVEVKGRDGELYFGKTFSKRDIVISFAFDHLTERKVREINDVFMNAFRDDDLSTLVFGETPYKQYLVAFNSAPILHFVPFDEYDFDGGVHRIYKGEGELNLTTYSYAHAPLKYLEEYKTKFGYTDEEIAQWSPSSGLKAKKEDYDTYLSSENGFKIENGGQLPTPFKLVFPKDGSEHTIALAPSPNDSRYIMKLKPYANFHESDTHIRVNGELCVIEGGTYVQDTSGALVFKPSGRIYNQIIEEGDFFKIPVGGAQVLGISNVSTAEIDYSILYY